MAQAKNGNGRSCATRRVKNMGKTLPRLHLRVAQDNPIYSVPAGQRNKKADEWLRIGYSVERLEQAAERLEKLVQKLSSANIAVVETEKPQEDKNITSDPAFQKDLKLIRSIMNIGEK